MLLSQLGLCLAVTGYFFFASRRWHTRCYRDWSSDVCSSDLCLGRGFPINVARAIGGLVVADGVQIVPAAPGEALQFAAHQRQDFVELPGGLNARVNDDLEVRIRLAGLLQEPEGETRADAESLLPVHAAPGKGQLDSLPYRLLPGNVGEINGPSTNLGLALFFLADDTQRKRGQGLLLIAQLGHGQDGLPGKNMLGQLQSQLNASKHAP